MIKPLRLLEMLEGETKDKIGGPVTVVGQIDLHPLANCFVRWLEQRYPVTGACPSILPSELTAVMGVYSLAGLNAEDALLNINSHVKAGRYNIPLDWCSNAYSLGSWEDYFEVANQVGAVFSHVSCTKEFWLSKNRFWKSLVSAIEKIEGASTEFKLPKPSLRSPNANTGCLNYAVVH